ncbi:MAG: phage tail tube protein [Thiohalospira sp.]
MAQARGGKARLTYVEEDTQGETPSSPSMQLLKALTYGESLGASIEELTSSSVNANRSTENARGGNINVSGSVPFELPIVGLGTLLKHALGSATTGQDITQPSAITGVTVLYAEDGATTGDGTLEYADAGTELTWTAPDDTAGSAVDVSDGGEFTLESSSSGESITVVVDPDELPSADESDTITVESQYLHYIVRDELPEGITVEKGFTDLGEYFRFLGCRIGTMSLSLGNSGLVTGELSLMGLDYEQSSSELGSPSDFPHVPLVHHEAEVEQDDSVQDIQSMELTIENNLSDSDRYVGSRTRYATNEGEGAANGSITFAFQGLDHFDDWDQENERSLRVTFTTSDGRLEIHLPRVKFFGQGIPPIETRQGIMQPLDYRALHDTLFGTDVAISLVNDEDSV